MVFYLLLVVYFLCTVLSTGRYRSDRSKKIAVFLYLLPLFLLVALRDRSIGPDTNAYYRIFYNIASRSNFLETVTQSRLEPGYYTLCFLIGKLGGSYYLMQIIISAFIFCSFGRFIRTYSINVPFTCFILLADDSVFGMMNVARMWIAVAILLYAIAPLQRRNLKLFILIVLIASLFHYSASIFLIMYPISSLKITADKLGVLFIAAIGISVAELSVFGAITNVLGIYQNYLTEDRFDTSDNLAVKVSLAICLCYFLLTTVTHIWESSADEIRTDSNVKSLSINCISYWAMILSVCVNIIGLSNNLMGRISHYFSVFGLLSIPQAINNMKVFNNRLIMKTVIMILMFIVFAVILIYRPNWYMVIPYKFFFVNQ